LHKGCAKEISAKCINPPYTLDFAILFIPTESLYAEVLRQPGLSEQLQRDYRVMIAGPTNLAALLTSFQMGLVANDVLDADPEEADEERALPALAQ
jgi:DNA recombination protein RmuC